MTDQSAHTISAGLKGPAFSLRDFAIALNSSNINHSVLDYSQDCRKQKRIYVNLELLGTGSTAGMAGSNSITILLQRWRNGDSSALDILSPLVYQELHRIADYFMRAERRSHTLQPTALVNEAFIKLIDCRLSWADRKHFYAVAAKQMRHILIDYARARERKKRGSDYTKITFNGNEQVNDNGIDILEIDDVLGKLKALDLRKHDMLELFYFGGLKISEIALCYQLSTKTVQRELRMAEAFLYSALYSHEDHRSTVGKA